MEDPQGAVSEKQWLKKRRTSVSELITTPPAKVLRKEDLGDEVSTPAHEKELMFNTRKHEANLFNALRSNTVKAHEVPAAVNESAAKHFEKVVRLAPIGPRLCQVHKYARILGDAAIEAPRDLWLHKPIDLEVINGSLRIIANSCKFTTGGLLVAIMSIRR